MACVGLTNIYPAPQNAYPPPRAYQNPTRPAFWPNQAFKNERLQKKKTFTPLGESYTSLFHRLRQLDMLRLIESKLPNPLSRNLDYSVSCEYCSSAPGNDTEKCWQLKNAIQELIDTNRIKVQALEAANINENPLPAYQETNMIEIVHKGGEPKKPSQTVMMIRSSEVKPVEKSTSERSVIKLSWTNSEPSAVVKKGWFSSDVVAKQERAKVVVPGVANKHVVLVDNACSANICPLSTLNKLKVDDERIYKNNICVQGFDGGGKDSVGDIVLELTIGPVEFTMEFQVLDVAVSYNLLLGRPWIHVAKAVPSTLHQMVKFEWDRQEIIVQGEDNLCVPSDAIVLFIEVEDDKAP
ncbi:uncharacterized protein [Nicotiana sylvestris]|uniref:uncharacterized protein n=1 Tax=Nicotiana sylvestris TaxID=4096 RepID=UPI00388C6F19